MTAKHARPAWTRALLSATAALMITAGPLAAQGSAVTEECRATVWVSAAGGERVGFNFRAWGHAVMWAREEARRRAVNRIGEAVFDDSAQGW